MCSSHPSSAYFASIVLSWQPQRRAYNRSCSTTVNCKIARHGISLADWLQEFRGCIYCIVLLHLVESLGPTEHTRSLKWRRGRRPDLAEALLCAGAGADAGASKLPQPGRAGSQHSGPAGRPRRGVASARPATHPYMVPVQGVLSRSCPLASCCELIQHVRVSARALCLDKMLETGQRPTIFGVCASNGRVQRSRRQGAAKAAVSSSSMSPALMARGEYRLLTSSATLRPSAIAEADY